MSIYATGVEAYRDTTKWLAAFLPITALGTGAVVLGRRVVTQSPEGTGTDGWVVVALGVAVAAVGAVLWSASEVLSVDGIEVGALVSTDGAARKDLAEAFGAGLGLPHFLDRSEFEDAVKQRTGLSESRLAAVATTTDAIRDWSIFREVRARFRRFVWVFAGATIVLGGVGIAVLTSVAGAPAIQAPTGVIVTVDPAGSNAATAATGCTNPGASTWVAIGGTLQRPVLDPAGPGCRPAATWTPAPGEAEITYVLG